MKKIISILLTVILASGLFVLPVSAKSGKRTERGWEVVNGLGIADFDASSKEESLSRAEFAELIARMIGAVKNDEILSAGNAEIFQQTFYEGMSYDGYSDSGEQSAVYADVEVTDDAYDAICALKALGIMCGDGTGYFYPDRHVTYEEAIRVFIMLASYNIDPEVAGAWTTGYMKLAEEVDITLRGVATGAEITKEQLCEIVYKLFDVKMMHIHKRSGEMVIYKKDDTDTFLNYVLGLYVFEGQLEGTPNSSLVEPYEAKNEQLIINGISYKNQITSPLGSILGREVEAYRTKDKSVVFLTLTDTEDITVINADDIESYANGTLKYNYNGRTKSTDISGLPIIYNGVAVPTYTDKIFDIDNGSITLTDGAPQDVVIIWDYKDMLVGSVSEQNKAYYDSVTGYKLDVSDNNTVYIFDSNGNQTNFDAVDEKSIISYIENGTYKEIYIGGGKKEGVYKGLINDERQLKLDSSTISYTKDLEANNELILLQPGNSITVYTDKFGKIFHIETGKTIGETSGVLQKALFDDETVVLKVFDSSGTFVKYTCNDKVTFTNKYNSTEKLRGDAIVTAINGYVGYITFTLNADEKVTSIQIPLASKKYLNEGEDKVYEKAFSLNSGSSYRTGEKRLGSSIFLNADTKMYYVPDDTANTDEWQRFVYTALNDYQTLSGKAYFKGDDNRPIPEAVVTSDLSFGKIRYDQQPQVVTKIRTCLLNDDVVKEVELTNYSSLAKTTLYSYVDKNGLSDFDKVETLAETGNKYKLSVGDIVFYSKKPNSDEVSAVTLLYSCNMDSPSGRGKKGWFADMGIFEGAYTNKYLVNRATYDAWKNSEYDDFYDYLDTTGATMSSLKAQNPFTCSVYNGLGTNPYGTNTGYLYMLGYVVDYVDGIAKLTNQDLSCETYAQNGFVNYGDKYVGMNFERYVNLVVAWKSNAGLIEYHPDGVVVRTALESDIYSYKKTKSNCSRVIICGDKGYIIINDYR